MNVLKRNHLHTILVNYSKMVKPRKNKSIKKPQVETEAKEDEGTISLLQKFRHDPDSKSKINSKESQAVNDKESDKVKADEKVVVKEETAIIIEDSPEKSTDTNKKVLKRLHVKLDFDENSTKTENAESVAAKKNNFLAVWEPDNWKEVLENLRIMRMKKDAPVDTMGCHMAADENADPVTKRFHFLVALMLSSQTKDQVTYEAMQRLMKIPGGLTIETIRNIDEEDLGLLLRPVGFYKTKAKHIKLAVEVLKDQYDSDIPKTAVDLCKLPGVGPKMAHICMQVAWNEISGIGVDTHVHRISNRLGWMKKTTKTPEETRIALEKWLPREWWADVNTMMVGLGQTICKPIKPYCSDCLNKSLCPVGQGKKKA